MLKLKIINYHDHHTLNEINFDDYDLIILANTYEQEFKVLKNSVMEYDSNIKQKLIDINDYIMSCYDAYNGVSELNLHLNKE